MSIMKTDHYVVLFEGKYLMQDSSSGPMATGADFWGNGFGGAKLLTKEKAEEILRKGPAVGYEAYRDGVMTMLRVNLEDIASTEYRENPKITREKLVETALNKLTEDERAALGVGEFKNKKYF